MSTISIARRLCGAALGVLMLCCVSSAQASISLSATRVIFDGKYKEASIAVRNGNSNILVQSWIESNQPGDKGDLPFAVTPPLVKMQANGQQLLRVLYAGANNDLPQDRESVFWLNVQEIPEAAQGDAVLQVAVRQRIKLFFRPVGLRGVAADAPAALRWRLEKVNGKSSLSLENPSNFHVSINSITVGAEDGIAAPLMIGPGESRQFPLKTSQPDAMLKFHSVNDYGGSDVFKTRLNGADAVTATAEK